MFDAVEHNETILNWSPNEIDLMDDEQTKGEALDFIAEMKSNWIEMKEIL